MTQQERLKRFLIHKNLSQAELARQLDMSRMTLLNNLNKNIYLSTELCLKIKYKYPELDLNWLLIGEGEMILRDPQAYDKVKHQVNEVKGAYNTTQQALEELKGKYSTLLEKYTALLERSSQG